jgi:hypothetical protein
MNKFTENCKKVGNLYQLYEDIAINKDTIVEKKALIEKLTENVGNKDLKVFSTYTIKLWDGKNKNKNGRNYHRVFEKVIAENAVTVGLVNHPDNDGDPKDIFAVERNPRIINDWLCVDINLIGNLGQLCESILEAGGPVEFSSAALGDVENNGDVLEEGFRLQRFCDQIFSASNGLLFFKDSPSQQTEIHEPTIVLKDKLRESEEIDTKALVEEKLTILDKDNGEKTMSDKLLEKTLNLNIKGMIKEAAKESNFSEKKSILENALDASKELSDTSLTEEITKKIDEVNKEITELAEKGKTVGTLTESANELKEAVTKITKEKEELTVKIAKLQEDITSLTKEKEDVATEHKALVEMYEKKEYEAGENVVSINKGLNTSIKVLKEKINKLSKSVDYYEALSNTKVDADVVIELKEKANLLERKSRILERKLDSTTANKSTKLVEFANSDVEEYFNDLVKKDKSLLEYKKEFINCKSLREASLVRLSIKDSDTTRTDSILDKKLNVSLKETTEVKDTSKVKVSAWEKEFKNRGWK